MVAAMRAPGPFDDLAALLEGRWRLERVIEDAAAGEMRLAGEAVFSRDGAGLLYAETGRWLSGPLGGMTAERRDLWRFPAPGRAEVLFEDGRPFHDIAPDARGRAEAVHPCGPDLYRVAYAFDLPGEWSSRWRVGGPRKDYLSTSRFRR